MKLRPLALAFSMVLLLSIRPTWSIDYQAEYGLENDDVTSSYLYRCIPLNTMATTAQREHAILTCNVSAHEVTLSEYLSMQDGCSAFELNSSARSECAKTVTKLHRHFAADAPPVALPSLTVYEQALLIEGCAYLAGDKKQLCQSGAKKLGSK